AHSMTNARSVIVGDRGILSILFLNNNFHAVHHSYPSVPWYDLPSMFQLNKDNFLTSNNNYYYKNYFTVFKKYLLVKKEKLVHPYWNLQNRTKPLEKKQAIK
ncbi:fatty acid desaturase, partial [Amylibacter sp.]|nr:fatty acid desaturase [Amylibacter sp.]